MEQSESLNLEVMRLICLIFKLHHPIAVSEKTGWWNLSLVMPTFSEVGPFCKDNCDGWNSYNY